MATLQQQLEEQLWETTRGLRQSSDIYYWIRYLVGLLFLKYLDDHSKDAAELTGDCQAFQPVIPPAAQWAALLSGYPDKALAAAIAAFDSHPNNGQMCGALSALGLSELGSHRELYKTLISTLSRIDLSRVGNMDLGKTIDRLLEKSAEAVGQRGGMGYTPLDVSQLAVELLAPAAGATIYDPVCGVANMLRAAYQQASREDANSRQMDLYGQEINSHIAALAKINLFLWGVPMAHIATGNTLLAPQFLNESAIQQFDYIIGCPPIGLKLHPPDLAKLESDPHQRFSHGIPRNFGDLAFVQHVVASLNSTGRAVMLVGIDMLLRSGYEAQIRKSLVEADLIEAIISLPPNLLFHTGIPIAALVLNKAKPQNLRKKILFVYAVEEYERGRSKNYISDLHRQRIVQAVKDQQEQRRFTAIITLDQIEANDCVLIPAKHIDLVGIDTFLGGTAQLKKLGETADVFQGVQLAHSVSDAGNVPVIRGRDLAVSGLTVDDLAKVENTADISKPIYSETGDVLIQRIGLAPRACLIEQELSGVLVGDTVYIIRLQKSFQHISQYFVEFLNSNVGQALLATQVTGASIPALRLRDLRNLSIPIPERSVLELIHNLHQVERNLVKRINTAQYLRRRLFSIDTPDQVSIELRNLNTEAQILAASLVQADDLDFQIRNFYPFPIAYAFRLLSAIREPERLYQEQLRVAENILSFLGSVGLALAAHTCALSKSSNDKLTQTALLDCWNGGISPGDWQSMAYHAGNIMRGEHKLAVADSFASLWFKGSGKKASEFSQLTKILVELKNDFKHDRGPKTTDEYDRAAQKLDQNLRQCLESLAFFVQHPAKLVQYLDLDWQTKAFLVDVLVYVGDHPGLRREQVQLAAPLPTGKLYLEVADQEWVSLYPLISVHHCPTCKALETYMIDYWDGPGKRLVLKSFERGHTLDNTEATQSLSRDLEHWFHLQFSKANVA